MHYELIGTNDRSNVKNTFLSNRGITDVQGYCYLNKSCVNNPYDLDNIADAAYMYINNVNENKRIGLLIDCDADGFCSAAMIYNYTKHLNPNIEITYYLHTGKQHGLSKDIVIDDDIEFLIIPDAATNDAEQCKVLKDRGVDILILDHHIKEVDNPYAIVVNNQCSPDYDNKQLCGAGMVYRFLQVVDEETWNDYADTMLDFVALANIADVMDMRSFETKYLVDCGLKQIVNRGIEAFVEGQRFQIKGDLIVHHVEWHITPLINAVCRVGSQEDKEILFKSFIGDESEEYDAKKKDSETGKFVPIKEDVYAHAFRVAKNCKSRQDNAVKKLMPKVREWIDSHGVADNAVIFGRLPSDVDGVYTGLIAIKIANEYRKPTLILRKVDDKWSGSGRNFDRCPLDSFKDLLDSTNQFDFIAGHDNAFGAMIEGDNVKAAIDYCNDKCKDIDFEAVKVDFSLDYSELDMKFIRDVDKLKPYFGAGLKEPVVHISNVVLQRNQGVLIGKQGTTWKFTDDDNIVFLKFTNPEDDLVMNFLNDSFEDEIVIKDMICKVGFNEFGGVWSAQVQVLSYEV